jgi:hypothetical protein
MVEKYQNAGFVKAGGSSSVGVEKELVERAEVAIVTSAVESFANDLDNLLCGAVGGLSNDLHERKRLVVEQLEKLWGVPDIGDLVGFAVDQWIKPAGSFLFQTRELEDLVLQSTGDLIDPAKAEGSENGVPNSLRFANDVAHALLRWQINAQCEDISEGQGEYLVTSALGAWVGKQYAEHGVLLDLAEELRSGLCLSTKACLERAGIHSASPHQVGWTFPLRAGASATAVIYPDYGALRYRYDRHHT